MDGITLIGAVLLAHLLAVISPGPDFIMVVRQSLTYSRQTGIYTALGVGAGIAVHLTYCAAGLALIISQSILLFNTLKLLGAAYLVYIGIKSFLAKGSHIELKARHKTDISPLAAIRIGFLTNVLNPKATLFFLSLFTFIISPQTPPHILLIASILMIVNTAAWFILVALFLTHAKIRARFEAFQGGFNKFFGVVLVGIGLKVALSK